MRKYSERRIYRPPGRLEDDEDDRLRPKQQLALKYKAELSKLDEATKAKMSQRIADEASQKSVSNTIQLQDTADEVLQESVSSKVQSQHFADQVLKESVSSMEQLQASMASASLKSQADSLNASFNNSSLWGEFMESTASLLLSDLTTNDIGSSEKKGTKKKGSMKSRSKEGKARRLDTTESPAPTVDIVDLDGSSFPKSDPNILVNRDTTILSQATEKLRKADPSTSDVATNQFLTMKHSESLRSSGKEKTKDKKPGKKIAWTSAIEVSPLEASPSMLDELKSQTLLHSTEKLAPDQQHPRPTRMSLASKRQSNRIDNKEKLETRWNWNQELVAKDFLPYKKMLAEEDELLPNLDELDSFQDVSENKHYDRVLGAMLEGGDLSEREIAAFFEGLALSEVKVKSLQSQLEFLKAEKLAGDKDITLLRRSFKSTGHRNSFGGVQLQRQSFGTVVEGSSHPDSPSLPASPSEKNAANTDLNPTTFKSLRSMSIMKIKEDKKDDTEVQRLLAELDEAEKKQKKLEKQLQQAGIVIAEDIPYLEAQAQVERISKRMQEIGSSDIKHEDRDEEKRLREEYFRLEQDMDKYSTALMMSDEYIEKQEELEQKWEDDNAADNEEALKKIRRCMPVDVKLLTEVQLYSDETPNGKVLPKTIAMKFKRTNVLQLLRTNPDDIVRMHPSTLENLRVTGLTLIERRAIHAHLKQVGPRWKAMQGEPMTERKWRWYKMMKQNFRENLDRYQAHILQYGPPGNHPYATHDKPNLGCPLLGKQCPLRADAAINYDDYGYSDEAVYDSSVAKKANTEDPGAKAMREAAALTREKKANQRAEGIKRHYKGKVLQVSLACGSCEAMDEAIDRMDSLRRTWIEERLMNKGDVSDHRRRARLATFSDALNDLKLSLLAFAERSGMQLTGKKDSNADQPDVRSPIEIGLSEEVCETCLDLFEDVNDSLEELSAKDVRLKSTIDQLRELLDELHERNVATLIDLRVERPERSRKLKSSAEIKREITQKLRASEKPQKVETKSRNPAVAGDAPGRGGVMAALAGRGSADLLSAIAGRGRGIGGRSGMQSDLMAALAARGRGRG